MTWTDKQNARLRDLAGKDISASDIATRLMDEFPGFSVSRSAVLGKIHRDGIARPRGREGSGGKALGGYVARAKRSRMTWLDEFLPPQRRAALAEMNMAILGAKVGQPRPVLLANLEPHHCRWVIGEPRDMRYCGADRQMPHPYCEEHARRAYDGTGGRKRQRFTFGRQPSQST